MLNFAELGQVRYDSAPYMFIGHVVVSNYIIIVNK